MGEVQGRILEDEELIITLDASKVTSATVNRRMKQSKITQEEIFKARENYRVVAKRGSVLYFAIADLALIDPVLQKQTFKKGPQVLLKLGDQDIPYHNDFRY